MPPKSKDVRELLLDLFTKQELRMFLADFAEYEDFDDGVNWGQNFKSAAHDVVERLEARGLVDSTLRGRLLEGRSGRAASQTGDRLSEGAGLSGTIATNPR